MLGTTESKPLERPMKHQCRGAQQSLIPFVRAQIQVTDPGSASPAKDIDQQEAMTTHMQRLNFPTPILASGHAE